MRHPNPSQIAWMEGRVSDNRSGALVGEHTLCLALAIIAVALRLVSRVKVGTRIGLDDWLICGALVSKISSTLDYG